MTVFSSRHCVSHTNEDVDDFVQHYLRGERRSLFIGTVGIDVNSLYFPRQLVPSAKTDFRFIVEQRPNVAASLTTLGNLHRGYLTSNLPTARFTEVEIIARDGATVAGRNGVAVAQPWFAEHHQDIVIDATGMSRGTCFPLVRRALEVAGETGANVHLLVAASDHRILAVRAESNDRADWMHGFQAEMGVDRTGDSLKLWVPQLTERAGRALDVMYTEVGPAAEVCPIVPFPSKIPRRGDDLVYEYRESIEERWDSSVLNLIYAHESDPLDVFRSIARMHGVREKAFSAADQKTTTVLSPAGWRIGSLGMLLAAIDLQLPILYVETIGYSPDSAIPSGIGDPHPDHLWHIWLAGTPYQ